MFKVRAHSTERLRASVRPAGDSGWSLALLMPIINYHKRGGGIFKDGGGGRKGCRPAVLSRADELSLTPEHAGGCECGATGSAASRGPCQQHRPCCASPDGAAVVPQPRCTAPRSPPHRKVALDPPVGGVANTVRRAPSLPEPSGSATSRLNPCHPGVPGR